MKPGIVIFFIMFISCNSNEIADSKDVSQENIFQHYSINYKEGEDDVEVLAQFRFGSVTGATIMLNEPAMIRLDGKEITVDSSTALGAFYRTFIPVKTFYGKHAFEYTDMSKRVFRNEFSFDKFSVAVPDSTVVMTGNSVKFISSPLKGDDRIELASMDSDSSFKVIHTATDNPDSIIIPQKELRRQRDRFLTLTPVLFRKIALQENTTDGGEIEIRYVLKPLKIKLRD